MAKVNLFLKKFKKLREYAASNMLVRQWFLAGYLYQYN